MVYVRRNGKPIFTSGREVIAYYTLLIEELTPQLQETPLDTHQATRTRIAQLRRQLANQLKNFAPNRVDEYFSEMMANATSDKEYSHLSNAYEEMLLAQLTAVKQKLHALRTT